MPPSTELEERMRNLEADHKAHVAECIILRQQFIDIAKDVKSLRDTAIRRGAYAVAGLVVLQIIVPIVEAYFTK